MKPIIKPREGLSSWETNRSRNKDISNRSAKKPKVEHFLTLEEWVLEVTLRLWRVGAVGEVLEVKVLIGL